LLKKNETMNQASCPFKPATGVYPVLPTPFKADKAPDIAGLRALVRYLVKSGVDGMTYPGVASEFSQLSEQERAELTAVVLDEVAGRVPVIAGVTSSDLALTLRLAKAALKDGAMALMIAAPPDRKTIAEQIDYFTLIANDLPDAVIMLQNVPPPVGAGLDPEIVVQILKAVPTIRYVKEEALPSGQRLSIILATAPPSLAGVFGGAGGRYITDELRRGACGTMPAIELAEVHVALFAAHRKGDANLARHIFTRMLPVLNIQAVFRWSLTKYVLKRRGLISSAVQRIAGPTLDHIDQQDVDAFMRDLDDLLLPQETLDLIVKSTEVIHGAA
jgi:4-hydroxy-tetrahydrodipicolinate synthase